ncbi:MAG: DUF5134 domain-containing protein [Sporichthyaceae bacterium]
MHNHGDGIDTSGVWLNLLPLWLAVMFVLALAAVAAWSLLRVLALRGALRTVAGLHLLAGVGMLDMFAPWSGDAGRESFWQVVFATATVGAVAGAVWARRSRTGTSGLWTLAAVDAAAMAYMFALFNGGVSAFTYALIALFTLLAISWAYGVFDEVHAPMCARTAALPGPLSPARVARFTQSAMAASMAYMFLLMDTHTGTFFGKAFTVGLTEQTYWVLAFAALALRFAADPALVRQLGRDLTRVAAKPA